MDSSIGILDQDVFIPDALSGDELEFFVKHGWVMVKQAVPQDQVDALRKLAQQELVESPTGDEFGISKEGAASGERRAGAASSKPS